MNTITNQETLSTLLSQQADLAKLGVVAGTVIMVAGTATANIPVAVSGGIIIAGSLWMYSAATDNKTTVKLSVCDLIKIKITRERNISAAG